MIRKQYFRNPLLHHYQLLMHDDALNLGLFLQLWVTMAVPASKFSQKGVPDLFSTMTTSQDRQSPHCCCSRES